MINILNVVYVTNCSSCGKEVKSSNGIKRITFSHGRVSRSTGGLCLECRKELYALLKDDLES